MDENYFKESQPTLAKLFQTARSNGRLAHAYLLVGDLSAPLLECAMYLAKSLFCQEKMLACNACQNCLSFDQNNHPDFTLIDGSKATIKKEDVLMLSEKYSLGTVEKGHVASYVIGSIDNITGEAANALLKFLEEPSCELVAFLTTTNIERCLPTIVSRCVTVKVNTPSFDVLEKENPDYSKEMLYALSIFASTHDKIKEISVSPDFLNAYQVSETFCDDLISSYKKASYFMLKEGLELLKSANSLKYFTSICIRVFSDALSHNNKSPFVDWVIGLKEYSDKLPNAIEVLEDMNSTISANMNLTFQIARLINSLNK